MTFLSTLLIGFQLGITSPAVGPSALPLDQWLPEPTDQLIVDTENNSGTLRHNNGDTLSFAVVTGQKRTVRYIGRVYNARTPERQWIAKNKEVKGDRVTFGPRGIFLRLYNDNGETETAYGIHGHRDSDEMLGQEKRFRSMGCIIVSEEILDVILRTFDVSGGAMPVTTMHGKEKVNPEI